MVSMVGWLGLLYMVGGSPLYVRGGVKKNTVFFTFGQKGGGLAQSKRVLSEKLRFFGIIFQKRVFF